MSKQPWAYIDTDAYWLPGTNKIGTFGKVDFVSDRDARKLTRTYRSTYTGNGRSLGLDYYIIKVRFHGDGTEVIALYDDASHNVLFDDISIPDFTFKLDAWITFDDSDDIVQMAKRRNGKSRRASAGRR